MSDTAQFLETLYGHGSGFVHLSETKRQLAAVKCSDVAELVEAIDGKTDEYLSAAVIGSDTCSAESSERWGCDDRGNATWHPLPSPRYCRGRWDSRKPCLQRTCGFTRGPI